MAASPKDRVLPSMTEDDVHTTRLRPLNPSGDLHIQRIELFYKNHLYVVEASRLPFRIGRDSSVCDMVVMSDLVSRLHCVLQVQDDLIGLQDSSTNGTSVRIGSAASLFIHHKFCPLAGQGALQLGQDTVQDDADAIHFKVITD